MATAIFFGGRRINDPGAYSEIDASALAGLSPGAVGIVALIGTAEGGKPLSVDPTYSDATRSSRVQKLFRSGNLRTAGSFAFAPSNDEAIPGGAQRIIFVKVNPATQSSVILLDSGASDSVQLTSRDWGLFTAQINVLVEDGTTQGKKITINFEDTTEVLDDVGGDGVFDCLYAGDYDTALARVTKSQFEVLATKAEAGLVGERIADIPSPGPIRIKSGNAADTTQTVKVFGLDGSNNPISQTLTLAGTADVDGTTSFTKVLGCVKSAATVGTVFVTDQVAPTTLFSLLPAELTKGVVALSDCPAAGVATISQDIDSAGDFALWGETPAGGETAERFDMTTAATTPVVGTVEFGKLTYMALGDLNGARTATVAINAFKSLHSVYTTVQKVVDYLNATPGFTATALVTNPTTFLMTEMDVTPASSPKDVQGGAKEFEADIYAFVTAINNGSGLVEASWIVGASYLPPANVGPVYLTGGTEGAPTISEWTSAFNLLKRRRANIIVPCTQDPAVHNLLVTHLKERAGVLRSEANGYVGIGTVGGAGESRANIKSQIQVLGTRHVSALSQEIQKYDPDTGLATWYPPWMQAVISAGMQAGSPIGEPLTKKRPNVVDIRQDASWTPEDDKEEMIDAGLMFCESNDNVGIRFVRSITTHLADDNVVFTEMSANESANTAVFELRSNLELKIGQRGLAGSVAAIKGLANDVLSRLVDDEIIVAYRALEVEQVGDVFPVSVEIAPVLPINFIPITVHLVATQIAA